MAFHAKTVRGENPDEMDDEIEAYLNAFGAVHSITIQPFVDRYGADDDGWYKATVIVESQSS